MKKISVLFLSVLFVLNLAACGSPPPYQDSYKSPWNIAQTSESLRAARQSNQAARLEPQIDWRDSSNIRNNVERSVLPTPPAPSETAAQPEHRQVYTQTPPPAAVPAPQGVKVKVGLLVPLSGRHEAIGTALLNAAQLALFDVGSANFELVPRDTKGTPEGARAAARSMANEGIDLVLGPLFSSSVTAIKPVTQPRGIPVIAFSTDWNIAGSGVYIMGFLPFNQVARVTNYALSRGYDRMALFAPNGEYGDMVRHTLKGVLAANNIYPVKQETYPVSATDLQERIALFTENERRAVNDYQNNQLSFNALMLPVGGQAIKTISTYFGLYHVDTDQVKLLGTGLWDDPSLASEPLLSGAWFAAPDPRLRRGFERSYRETYSSAPPRIASLAYDGTALAAILAQSANGISGEDVYSPARLTSNRGFAGIDGIFRFRPDGLIERGIAVQEITPGGLRVIDPAPTAFMSRQPS